MLDATYGQDVKKADAQLQTGTTGAFNAIYGAMAFSQLNQEANVFAALPKYPWQHSGFRAITADAGATRDGGVAEGAALPETIRATFAQIDVTAKEIVHNFDVSYKHENLVGKDDAFGSMAQLRPYFANLHAKRINEQLLTDANTLAGTGMESVDRVTGSFASLITSLSYTAGDEDVYGIDRSANSWADAVSDDNGGTDREVTFALIRNNLATLQANGARTNLIVTGSDTYWKLVGDAETNVRYQAILKEGNDYSVGVNGVSTDTGIGYGVRIATIYGIPVIVSQAVPQDGCSRVYLLDTTENEGGIPRLGVSLLSPTLYAEAGMSAGLTPFGINKLATEGMYYTSGELVCTFFKAQGSIRDLKLTA